MNKRVLLLPLFCLLLLNSSCTDDDEITYGVWERRSDFDGVARGESCGFMLNGNGYVCCGYEGKNRLNDLWEYNVDGNYWTQKASLPDNVSKRNSAVGFSVNGKGYITTGYDGNGYLKDTWEYDPSTNTWQQKDDFPKGRIEALAFAIGDYGYVGTGYDGNYLKDMYRFDPTASEGNQWTILNGYGGQKRRGGNAFVINDKAYIVCGSNNNTYVDDFWVFDPSQAEGKQWEQKRDISDTSDDDYDDDYTSIVRSDGVCMVIDDKAYLVTGGPGTLLSNYWVYDPQTDLWNNEDFTPFEGSTRKAAVGFSTGTRGFVVTGRTTSTYFDDVWELLPYEIEED